MKSAFKKALNLIIGDSSTVTTLRMPKDRPLKKLTERELIQLESEIGATLFGKVVPGYRREFFCLDENTWIWHEEGKNSTTGKTQRHTIRYEVHDNGVLKVQDGPRYAFIDGTELDNFVAATKLYHEQVARHVYKREPAIIQKAA